MSFYSYEGISDQVLDEVHTTSTGETYTLRHNENLKVEMQYVGKGKSNANSQGWERNSSKYFDTLYQNHPEMFSKKNIARLKDGHAPIVDAKMISHNPQWAQYKNQPLIHHHIGGDGEAVAVPKNAHKGQGEIHNYEKEAGITDNCKNFSRDCANQPDSFGKKASELHMQLDAKQNGSSNKNNTNQKVTPQNNANQKNTNQISSNSSSSNLKSSSNKSVTREKAVRDSVNSSNNTSNAQGRSNSVRSANSNAAKSSQNSSQSRSDSVRNSVNSGRNNSSKSNGASQSSSSSHSASTGCNQRK